VITLARTAGETAADPRAVEQEAVEAGLAPHDRERSSDTTTLPPGSV
jgi:hypothetical protein